MGIEITQTAFTAQDSRAFKARLEENLAVLGQLLDDPDFGKGPASLGAELEMYIVDASGRPLHKNLEIQEQVNDPQLTLELNRYNLEYNLSPYQIDNQPFFALEQEITTQLEKLNAVAATMAGRIVPIGILPTLTDKDLGPHCITGRKRYHALVAQLIKRRGNYFQVDINGPDPLKLAMTDITLEGANTSFQVHYRVNPAEFADTFNAIQLVTPLALALAANSPTLFGHALWHETRVPLFKQSIDTRHLDRYGWNPPARVNFGQGWVRKGALEQFAEVVRIYEPLLPICSDTNPRQELANGEAPSLAELRLHQSTVWLWNRPIYDSADGGMLRIEMRSLPAGPTAVDMVANSAFLIGLAEGIKPAIHQLLPALPFRIAEYNFYRAAQFGLNARLVWPELTQYGAREQEIAKVLESMLPVAGEGLERIGVSEDEINYYLKVIRNRLETRQTGAVWQLGMLEKLEQTCRKREALHLMLEEFMVNSRNNIPVAEWPMSGKQPQNMAHSHERC